MIFLAIAAALLLVAIVVQDILYKPLQQETISEGLMGPTHVILDVAYGVLALALGYSFAGADLTHKLLAYTIVAGLLVTGFSNTAWKWVDKVTGGLHSKIHSYGTIVMFLAAMGLESMTSLWWVAANIAAPVAAFGVTTLLKKLNIVPGPAAEKAAVAVMCAYMIYLGVS